MPGRHLTTKQVEIYMTARKQGKTQRQSAAKADISERSGRNIDHNKRLDPKQQHRHWRTRQDPLADIWDMELLPMLEQAPTLQPMTLLEHIQSGYPDRYPDSVLRTLQRRIKEWRVLYGPEKDVMFRQTHAPGQQALSDFTRLKQTTITIAGNVFGHLLYHFRLAYSHWSYLKVIEGGESFTALAEGLQEALQRLGGAPHEHRTDSLSAAYKNLSKEAQDDITTRYKTFCDNYAMRATRNNPGVSHENGCVESPHGHLKRRIEQALLLRGSHDFHSIEQYQDFIDTVVRQHNRRNAKAIQIERLALQPLPKNTGVDYTQASAVVSCASTIDVRRVTYTVPSRLQGETLSIRLYHDRLLCYLGQHYVITLKRLHPKGNNRGRQIDYCHVIHSLIKKPQAFRTSQMRDDLLPNEDYRFIWQYVNKEMAPKQACKFIVGLLYLAATEDCEKKLADVVRYKIEHSDKLSLEGLQATFRRQPMASPPTFKVKQHALKHYNQLIPCYQEVRYA